MIRPLIARLATRAALAPLLLSLFVAPAVAASAEGGRMISAAERALFMSPHFASLRPPTTLKYRFVKSGRLEEGFEDGVSLALRALADGRCCGVQAEFFSGTRRMPMPEVDAPEGNPVLMYFLERDVREMGRLTRGQSIHFRKRIRLALAEAASILEVDLRYQGRALRGRQIVVSPYLEDPLRTRFAQLSSKRYVFTLCEAVPGGIAALRTEVIEPGAAPGEPLLIEELLLEGASVPRPAR